MYTLLVQLLNPKPSYMGYDKSLHDLIALRDIYALAIKNIKLSRERQMDLFMTYPIPECNAGDKVLVRYPMMDVWNPKYDVAYHAV